MSYPPAESVLELGRRKKGSNADTKSCCVAPPKCRPDTYMMREVQASGVWFPSKSAVPANHNVIYHLFHGGVIAVKSDQESAAFMTLQLRCAEVREPTYLSEVSDKCFRLFFDLDTPPDSDVGVLKHASVIVELVQQCDPDLAGESIKAVVLQSRDADGRTVGGVHIIFPNVIVTHTTARVIAECVNRTVSPESPLVDVSVYREKGSCLRPMLSHKKRIQNPSKPDAVYLPTYVLDADAAECGGDQWISLHGVETAAGDDLRAMLELTSIRTPASGTRFRVDMKDQASPAIESAAGTTIGADLGASLLRAIRDFHPLYRRLASQDVTFRRTASGPFRNTVLACMTGPCAKHCRIRYLKTHRSNNVFFIINLASRTIEQRCHDVVCKYAGKQHRIRGALTIDTDVL